MPNDVESPLGIQQALIMVLQPELEALRQKFNEDNPNWIVSPDTAALLAFRKQRDYGAMLGLVKRNGFNEDQFGLIMDTLRQYLTPDDVMTAYFRSIINEGERDTLLGILGYADRERELIQGVAEVIPNVQDVIRFLTRDVFIPEFVEAFGMDLEIPPTALAHFQRLGMSKETMVNHWRAHWELPSLSQGYEMFQRSKIDEVQLKRLMRAQGVEPFWRDPLVAIAYNPLTRVDIRRIQKLMSKDKDWLIRQYQNTGYDAENSNTLADFTIAYNKQEKKVELKDITDGLKSRVIAGVMSGSLKEIDARSLLAAIGYADAEISAFLTEAHLFRTDKHLARLAQLAGDLYVKKRMTQAEATVKLGEAGFGAEEIALLFREWDMEIALKAPDEHTEKDRDLTKAEILSAYDDGIVTVEEAKSHLVLMRYDAKEIDTLLAIADFKRKVREDKEAIEVVHQKFLSGALDESTAGMELDKHVKYAAQKDALLLKWTKEHRAKTADIPLSSVQEMFALAITDATWTDNYLNHMGFDADERAKLLQLWTTRASVKAATTAAAAANKAAKSGRGVGAP